MTTFKSQNTNATAKVAADGWQTPTNIKPKKVD